MRSARGGVLPEGDNEEYKGSGIPGLWGAGRTQEWVSRSKVVSKGQGEPGCRGMAGGHEGKIFLRVNEPSKLWGN